MKFLYLLIILTSLLQVSIAQDSDTLIVQYSTNLRETPEYLGESIDIIKRGDTVIVFNDFQGVFVKALYKGKSGYVNYKVTTFSDKFREWAYHAEMQKISQTNKGISTPLPSPSISSGSENTKTSSEAKTKVSSPKARSTTSRSYFRGPRGGCYYYSSSGKKVYVDKSLCN